MAHLAIGGGQKACDIEWPKWPIWGDEERRGLIEVLESGEWWYGSRVKEFERAFAEFQGAKFGVTCSTGTAALEAGLLALGIGAGDEVIVPAYTFVASASSVLRVNAIPIFADILPDTLCIDPDDAERKITDRTKAILPVHMGGYVADMDRLRRIASEHSLSIIEDACHSWGSQWKGKGTGGIGDCGAFSFQASKNITCSEGGILLTDSEDMAETARSYTNCGRGKDRPWYQHFVLGTNLRLTEFQAALLLGQLTRLESQTLRRQANAEIITDGIRDIPGIATMTSEPRMTRRAYHFYPFRVDVESLGISVDRFAEALSAEGVPAYPLYPYPLYKNPLFARSGDGAKYCPVSCPYYGKKIDYAAASCPVCEQVCRDTVILPHALLLADESAMHGVAGAIRKVCELTEELR